MRWKQTRASYRCVFATVAAAFLIASAQAQQANIQSIRYYKVKTDRFSDFLAATKEYSSMMAKGGSDHYFSLWHSLTGANEYARVDFYSKWADLDIAGDPKLKDQAAALQSLTSRILQCTESSHRIISEVLPDLSLPPSGELPKMIRVLRTRVRPDRVTEYLALAKNEVLPAVKKSGVKRYTLFRIGYGAPTTEFTSIAGFDSWSDLGGGFGVEKGMGEEGYRQFLAKVGLLVVEREFNIYSLVADSSYIQVVK